MRIINVEIQVCGEDMSLILRVHKSQAQGCPLVTEEGMGGSMGSLAGQSRRLDKVQASERPSPKRDAS